ncbi:MAG TPA: CocE/NonD family hydrolase [Steroidobacteraceae bacterium]
MLSRVLGILIVSAPFTAALAAMPASAPTHGVRMENTWIPMSDGIRLAVTLYLPTGGVAERYPALLEYLPYRKDDDEAVRDYGTHTYFAKRGFVGARVDIRGFGNSEGTPPDREYSAQEQQDGQEVIAWLARQSWSNGKVGMLGISWGGFNSIQIALRKPPALKAILAVDATEELFKEDVHYMDGIFHVDEFELTMDLDQGRTGAPDFNLEESVIAARMNSPPWSLTYMKHQRDGVFWRSPLRPIETLQVPAFLIGGLQDGYRDSIPRMLEKVKAPLKAWIGPWNHGFPNDSNYGPLFEWRDQAVRWFDYWLKGRDTGVLSDPKVIIYQQHWHPPGSQDQDVPGEWRAEKSWPPAGAAATPLYFQAERRLSFNQPEEGHDQLRNVPSTGVEAGFWWGELLTDQRPVDAYSLTYDSPALAEDFAILGRPRVSMRVTADAPLADWFIRLSDVAPDGSVTMVTGAGINGAQRDSMADPKDLVPGMPFPLSVDLHLASWVFPKGHRIRVAISNALWPMNWPTPYPLTTSIALGGKEPSQVSLPRVPIHGAAPPPLSAPEPIEKPSAITSIGAGAWPGSWTVLRDEVSQRSTVTWQGTAAVAYPFGRFDHSERLIYEIDDAHPELASVQGDSEYIQAVQNHVLTWRGRLNVSSDAHTFFYKYTRTLLKDGAIVKTKTWEEPIPRDHQ